MQHGHKVTECQNAAKTGTLWNTVSARIRSATKELEVLGEDTTDLAGGFSKYREELLARTGVDVQDAAGNYRDLYDIFVDIAAVWDDLADDQSRARVAEILGGTRNQAGIMSTIQNIKDAQGAYETALKADGVAARANERYMDTTAAHVQQLSASFQELSYNTFNSDAMKLFVDMARGLVEALNAVIKTLGMFGTVGLASVGGLTAKFGSLPAAFTALAGKIGISTAALGQFAIAGAAIFAVVAIVDALTTSFEEAREKASAATDQYNSAKSELEKTNSELENTQKRMDELSKKKLTPIEQKELDHLRDYNKELLQQQKLQQHLANMYQKDAASAAYEAYSKKKFQVNAAGDTNIFGTGGTTYEQIDLLDHIDRYSDRINEQQKEYNDLGDAMARNSDQQKTLESRIAKYTDAEKSDRTFWDGLFGRQMTPYQQDVADLEKLQKEFNGYNKRREELNKTIADNESGRTEDIRLASELISTMIGEDGKALPGYEDIVQKYMDTLENTKSEDEKVLSSFQDWLSNYSTDMQDAVNNSLSKVDTSNWSLDEYKDFANSVMNGTVDVEVSAASVGADLETAKTSVDSFTKSLTTLQSTIGAQGTGKSLSLEAYNSAELKDYTSALEYHNGALQLNVEKVNEITAAKAEEAKAALATDKAYAQSKYLQNAGEIDRLRDSLASYGSSSDAARNQVQSQIDALTAENATLADACSQYDLMTASINEATSAYQHWVNAQNATQSGDMFDSATSAFNKIRDTINGKDNANSADGWLKTGNEDYKAAIDFVIPENVDRDDTAAVQKYMDSIKQYLRFDDSGNVNGLNVEQFLQDSVKKGLMTVDESGDEFKVAGQKTMQDFADGLGLSLPLVQSIFGELEEFDFHFDWADEVPMTLGDMAMNARESYEALRGMEEYSDLHLVLDVSKFEDADKAVQALDDNIKKMNNIKSKVSVDSSEAEHANDVIRYCVAQKQALTQPAVMYVDTSQVSGAVGEALSLLQQFQELQNTKELMMSVDADADTSQVDAAIADVQSKLGDIEAEAKIGVDTSSIDSIQSYINNLTPEAMVKFGVDSSAVDAYKAADQDPRVTYHVDAPKEPHYGDQDPRVTYHLDAPSEPVYNDINRNITYHIKTVGTAPSGAHEVNGTAHALGTALAGGSWGAKRGGTALVGELGPEIVVNPRTGRWYTVGDAGAEFVNIPKGSIVFNHKQTESLLDNGYALGRATALASGTAMVTGGGKRQRSSGSGSSSSGSSSSRSSGGGSGSHSGGGSHSGSSGSNDSSSSSKKDSKDTALDEFKKWLTRLFDWIEIRISRTSDKIDRFLDRAKWAAEAGNYGSSSENYRNAINTTYAQLDNRQRGAQRYQEQANRVLARAVSKGLLTQNESDSIARKMVDGTIEISEYNERVQEVIKSYQTWYDKARESRNAVEELHHNIREYIDDLKDMRDAQRDAALDNIKNRMDIGTGGLGNVSRVSNNQLRYSNTLMSAQNAAYSGEVSALSGDITKIASGVYGNVKSQLGWKNLKKIKDPKARTAYINALKSAIPYLWSQKAVPWSILSVIQKYSSDTYTRLTTFNLAVQRLEEARMESSLNYAENSAKVYENLAKIYDSNDSDINDDIDLLRAREENSNSYKTQNKLLAKVGNRYKSILTNDNRRVNAFSRQQTQERKIITGRTATARNEFMNKSQRNDVNKLVKSARNAAKKGSYIPADVLSGLATYYSKGFITEQFYRACVDYNNALESKEQAIAQRDMDRETVKQERVRLGQERFTNVENYFQTLRDRMDANTSNTKAYQEYKTNRGLLLNENDYKTLRSQNSYQKKYYQQEINRLRTVVTANLRSGLWTTATQEYKDAMTAIRNYEAKVRECNATQQELNNSIANVPFERIERALSILDSMSNYVSSTAERKSAQGKDLSTTDYTSQMKYNNRQITQYNRQMKEAYNNYLKARKARDNTFGGKTANEWFAMYRDAGTEVNNLTIENEKLKDSLRDDVYWRTYERAHKAAERLQNVLSGISSLISDDMLFDKDGGLTRFGVAQIANLTKQYENARKEVQNYSKDINNLNRLYDKGYYTTEEYKEKLGDLQDGLLDAAKDMQGLVHDIEDIYKDMDKAQLDALFKLIDARNKALQAKKAYYDYDKNIRNKTKDIQELTAQIAALEGVNTAEAKAKSAKLKEQLADAQEDLAETQRNHAIQLSQDALSDLKNTLQDEFDDKWDRLNQNFEAVKQLLNDANTLAKTNTSNVAATLTSLLNQYRINTTATGVRKAFASGSKRINGNIVGLSNEAGRELLVTENGIITRFKPGEGVVPADLTERLFTLAEAIKPNSALGRASLSGVNRRGGSVAVNQTYGSLINIQGSADAATVSDLQRMSKELLEKSYTYTSKKILQDYVRTGGTRRI